MSDTSKKILTLFQIQVLEHLARISLFQDFYLTGGMALSALYERSEPKDFTDLYFIHKNLFPFETLWEKAKQKYSSLDTYGLAIALTRIRDIQKLPRMIEPLTIDELREFFLKKSREIASAFEQ